MFKSIPHIDNAVALDLEKKVQKNIPNRFLTKKDKEN